MGRSARLLCLNVYLTKQRQLDMTLKVTQNAEKKRATNTKQAAESSEVPTLAEHLFGAGSCVGSMCEGRGQFECRIQIALERLWANALHRAVRVCQRRESRRHIGLNTD